MHTCAPGAKTPVSSGDRNKQESLSASVTVVSLLTDMPQLLPPWVLLTNGQADRRFVRLANRREQGVGHLGEFER